MRSQLRLAIVIIQLLGLTMSAAAVRSPQRAQRHDALDFLKRALNEAGAPALTSDQEAQLNTLIANFRSALPSGPDETLKAARAAYEAAVLSGDLTAAQAQATIIANRMAELSGARLQAEAKFQTHVVAALKSGGQLDFLKQKLGDGRVVGLIASLAGGPPFGGPPFGGHPGRGTGFGPERRPGVTGWR